MRNDVLTVSDSEQSVVDSVGGGEVACRMLPGLGSAGKIPSGPTFPGVEVLKLFDITDYFDL